MNRFFLSLALFAALLPAAGLGQNVGALPDAPANTATFRSQTQIEGVSALDDATMPKGDEVLIPSLEGVHVDEMTSSGSSTRVYSLRSGDVSEEGEVEATLADYLGEPLTFDQLSRIRISLADSWGKETGEIVRVAIPPQDITNGILILQVVRARLGDLDVQGVQYFDSLEYTEAIRIAPGETIRLDQITNDIDWLERNPYRNVGVLLQQGDAFGETDLLLNVQEERPLQIFAGYDREGTELLGPDRWFFGGNHGNFLGKGHRVTYQYFTDVEFENSHGHFLSYLVPLPWRHELQVSGFYSESEVSTLSGVSVPGFTFLTNSGESWQTSLDYIIPLPRIDGGEHDLVFAFDAKFSDSNLDFGSLRGFSSGTETYQFRGEWRVRRFDRFGATAFRARITGSPGGWSPKNSDLSYGEARAGAEADYVYADLEYDRQTNLPAGLTLLTTAAWHHASTNQLAAEQLVLSGNGAVRGFERSRIRADQGLLLNAQLNAPSVASKIANQAVFTKPFVFVDYGTGTSETPLPGEPDRTHLSSAGLGFSTELEKHLSAEIIYAWQIGESGFNDGETGRWHIGVTSRW